MPQECTEKAMQSSSDAPKSGGSFIQSVNANMTFPELIKTVMPTVIPDPINRKAPSFFSSSCEESVSSSPSKDKVFHIALTVVS